MVLNYDRGRPGVVPGRGRDYFARAADTIAAAIPRGQRQTIDGQTHMVDPRCWPPVLERFLTGPA